MKFLNFFKKLQKGGFHLGLLLVGIAFVAFNVLPYILPDKFSNDMSPAVKILFILIGLGAIIFAIRGLKDVTTTSLKDANYFDKTDTAEVKPEEIERIRNNDEPVKDYYFRFCGKLNQSYILETIDRQPVYEFNCDKIGVVNEYVYTFKNHISGNEFTANISHTVTTSYGDDTFSLVDKSYFKINGQNIWEYIGNMGYSTEPYLSGPAFSFLVKHYGVEVADLKAAGANILPGHEESMIGKIPGNAGLYRVSCKDEDVEAVAIIAFAVSRVQII